MTSSKVLLFGLLLLAVPSLAQPWKEIKPISDIVTSWARVPDTGFNYSKVNDTDLTDYITATSAVHLRGYTSTDFDVSLVDELVADDSDYYTIPDATPITVSFDDINPTGNTKGNLFLRVKNTAGCLADTIDIAIKRSNDADLATVNVTNVTTSWTDVTFIVYPFGYKWSNGDKLVMQATNAIGAGDCDGSQRFELSWLSFDYLGFDTPSDTYRMTDVTALHQSTGVNYDAQSTISVLVSASIEAVYPEANTTTLLYSIKSATTGETLCQDAVISIGAVGTTPTWVQSQLPLSNCVSTMKYNRQWQFDLSIAPYGIRYNNLTLNVYGVKLSLSPRWKRVAS